MRGYHELVAARTSLDLADDFYDGVYGDQFTSQRIRRMIQHSGGAEIEDFNYAKIPVRVIASRLKLLPPRAVAARGGEEQPLEHANQVLEEIHRVNQIPAESRSLHWMASRYGEAYMFIWPVTEDTPPEAGDTPEDRDPEQDTPLEEEHPLVARPGSVVGVEMLVNSPKTVRAIYDPASPLHPAYVIKSWVVSDGPNKVTRANLYYTDHVEKWETLPGTNGDKDGNWIRTPGAEEDIPNPWGVQPFHHFRNSRPYGSPEHLGTYGPQQMINKLIASLAPTIDFQVFPQRYYMADPKLPDPLENLTDPQYPEDENDDPEEDNESPLDSHPSAVWKLYGRTAGQFDAASPDAFLRPFDRCVRAMAELSGLPQHYFGTSTGETPSGAALRVLDTPTTAIVEDRQEAYGPTWSECNEHALELMGIQDVRVPTRWKPAAVVNDLEGWQVVKAKQDAGVPSEQTLRETGYAAEEVAGWVKSAEGADLMRRIAALGAIGSAVQALAVGVDKQIVLPGQAQALIGQLIGQNAVGMEPVDPEPWPVPEIEPPTPPVPPTPPDTLVGKGTPKPPVAK